MIDQTVLTTYILIVGGFVFIPGPAIFLTIARASSSGTRVGIATALGIALGDIVHTILTVVGISAIILASALLFSVIKYLGAAYLVYLGLRAIFEKSDYIESSNATLLQPSTAFRQAIIAEILNPKTALFFLAFLPQFVVPENGMVSLQLMILGCILVLFGLIATLISAVIAGKVRSFLQQNPTIQRWQNRIVGGIFCTLGVRLALQER